MSERGRRGILESESARFYTKKCFASKIGAELLAETPIRPRARHFHKDDSIRISSRIRISKVFRKGGHVQQRGSGQSGGRKFTCDEVAHGVAL